MKKILSVLLVLIILLQVFVNVGIGVYYHFNKTYITQKLCDNKNNPKLHCNGHCYLSKRLKKAEEGESKSSQIIKEKEEIISNHVQTLPGKYFPPFIITGFQTVESPFYLADSEPSLLKPPVVAIA